MLTHVTTECFTHTKSKESKILITSPAMKALLTFLFFYIPALSFCQSSGLIDSVNEAIGPEYVFEADTVADTYHRFNLIVESGIKQGGAKLLVVVAGNADSSLELNKIFILARKDDELEIIDSSASYTVGDLGPYIQVKGNKLLISHDFEKGLNRLTYTFNNSLNRYVLSKLYYSNIVHSYNEDDHAVNLVEEYTVADQSLALKSSFRNYSNGKIDKVKTREISKQLPLGTALGLRKMNDPYDYDIFLTEGSLYKQMIKY